MALTSEQQAKAQARAQERVGKTYRRVLMKNVPRLTEGQMRALSDPAEFEKFRAAVERVVGRERAPVLIDAMMGRAS